MLSQFSNPPAANRPRPFWFLNGDLDRAEIRRQVLEMKEKGLGGFFLCARQRMRIPYLSRAWFDLCRYTVELARQEGLEAWLYDEYPYPSGMSGGEVTLLHPQSRQMQLELLRVDAEGGAPLEQSLGECRVLSAMAYPVRETVDYTAGVDVRAYIGILQNEEIFQHSGGYTKQGLCYKRFFTYGPSKELRWTPPAGRWTVVLAVERELEDFKYYGTYMDPADPDAVQAFLDTTYEPYKAALGADFGGVIKGMFTDETSYLGRWPWSRQLPDYIRARFGFALHEHMAALLDADYPDAARIRYGYYQAAHELIRERYHRRLAAWCAENGMEYVSEVPSMRLSNQMYSHVPGGDPCHDKLGLPLAAVVERDFPAMRSNPKSISSVARQMGRRDCVVESFHSIGWTMTLQDAKWQIDRLTLLGISLHNFHAFFYTTDGIAKHDASPSQFVQNPYWEHYRLFADYCARCSRFIGETESMAEVALYHPATSWWTCLRDPYKPALYNGVSSAEEREGARLVAGWSRVNRALLAHQVDYDDLDGEILLRGSAEQGMLRIGKACYRTLVVPPVRNIEAEVCRMMRRFAEGGGRVIFVGMTPYERIEKGFDPADYFADWGCLPRAEYFGEPGAARYESRGSVTLVHTPGGLEIGAAADVVAAAVRDGGAERIEVHARSGMREALLVHRRENAAGRAVMLSSPDGAALRAQVLFHDPRPGEQLFEYDLETGNVFECASRAQGDSIAAEVELSPFTSRILALCARPEQTVRRGAEPALYALDLSGELEVAARTENVYRLEELEVRIGEGPAFASRPDTFIRHFQQAAGALAGHIRFSDSFGTPLRLSVAYPARAAYTFRFTVESMPRALHLLRDQRGIQGPFTMALNGRAIPADAFTPCRRYDHSNRQADITEYARLGENVLTISLEAGADWHGVQDPLYVLGEFGVIKRDGRFVIGAAPGRAVCTDPAPRGYPFYSGTLAYKTVLTLSSLPEQSRFALVLPADRHIDACVELRLNGIPLGVRAFAPYRFEGDRSILRLGVNEVEISVTNTLSNLLEGTYFDYETRGTVEIR